MIKPTIIVRVTDLHPPHVHRGGCHLYFNVMDDTPILDAIEIYTAEIIVPHLDTYTYALTNIIGEVDISIYKLRLRTRCVCITGR